MGTERSIWCLVNVPVERGGEIMAQGGGKEEGKEEVGGVTLQDLEVLYVGILGVDVEFDPAHGYVLWMACQLRFVSRVV